MNIFNIIKNAGIGIFRDIVPGGKEILAAINAFLPDNKKMGGAVTVEAVEANLRDLTPEQYVKVSALEFNVKIEELRQSHETLRTMLDANAISKHTTRPFIAKWSFVLVAIITLLIVVAWASAVMANKPLLVEAIMGGWPFVVALLVPFFTLLKAYFGVLKEEEAQRLNAANKVPIQQIGGLVSRIFK